MLFGPLLFPVAKAIGVHKAHCAMVVILAMGIGLSAPPFGVGFLGARAIGRANPDDSSCANANAATKWKDRTNDVR